MRYSHVVYTLIRIPVTTGPSLLLRRHEKWGDWSLVGGHVEDWEMDDWSAAASREATEEMEPLISGEDFRVAPIHDEPVTWGPEASRSARGERTVYHIQYFSLTFLRDPAGLLGKLCTPDFLLIDERELATTRHALGNPVHRARRYLKGGFGAVPFAWSRELDPASLPSGLRHPPAPGGATG